MNKVSLCCEFIRDNIKAVYVYESVPGLFNAPPTVPLSSVRRLLSPPLLLCADLAPTDSAVLLSDAPSVKLKNSKNDSGYIFDHEIVLSVAGRSPDAESAVAALRLVDFCVEFECVNGSRLLSYPLPNTSVATVDSTFAMSAATSISLKLQSLSPLILCEMTD